MKVKTWHIIVFSFVALAFIDQCSDHGQPKVITKTKTVVEWKTDTITKTVIKEVPKTVYIEKVKTVKGKDSIIYKDKPTDTTIQANQYDTTLKSDSATAKLQITTTGELLDVKGSITYPSIEKTIETIKIRDNSGFFIYGSMPVNGNISPEIGGLYQFRNKIMIGTGVQYNNFTQKPDVKVTLGIRL